MILLCKYLAHLITYTHIIYYNLGWLIEHNMPRVILDLHQRQIIPTDHRSLNQLRVDIIKFI